jgi:hypothetical protein
MLMKRLTIVLLAVNLLGGTLVGCDQQPAVTEDPVATQVEQDLPRGRVTKFGLFRERGKGWVQDDTTAGTGRVIRGATLEFTEDTNRIPLRKGVFFGYRYWLKFPAVENQVSFRRVLIHPQMILPDGSTVTRSERNIGKGTTHGIVTSIDAYALSEDYELVEGEWIFQLWHEDKMLAEQKFTAYWPAEE